MSTKQHSDIDEIKKKIESFDYYESEEEGKVIFRGDEINIFYGDMRVTWHELEQYFELCYRESRCVLPIDLVEDLKVVLAILARQKNFDERIKKYAEERKEEIRQEEEDKGLDISERWKEDWHQLIRGLKIDGLLRQIAENCVVENWDGVAIDLLLDKSQRPLFQKRHNLELKKRISNFCNQDCILNIRLDG